MNKKQAFACLGATQKNERWSWSATSPSMDRVAITIWRHELMGKGKESYCDTKEIDACDERPWAEWQDHNGNRERIEMLKHSKEKLDGIVYVVICQAIIKDETPAEIGSAHPWESKDSFHRMKLKYLDAETGDFRVEYYDSIPKSTFEK